MVPLRWMGVVLLVLMAVSAAWADYQVSWYSVNSGGALSTGGSYRLSATIGQTAAGFVQSSSMLHWVGFWAGEVPTPTAAATVATAKLLPDGTFVCVAGKVATAAAGDFAGFFCIEEADRSSGLRVAAPPEAVAGLARGSVVNVIGTLGTTPAGERQLAGPIVIIVGTHAPLTPVGIPNRSMGGGDIGVPPVGQYGVSGGAGANNVGLLIKTWGRVTEVGAGYAVIDDGSGTPVRLDTSALASPPQYGTYVSVIGVSSLYKPGLDRLRLLLPRNQQDIRPGY